MENRESFFNRLHKTIDDLQAGISKLEEKFNRASGDFKVKYEPELNELREKKRIAEEKLKYFKSSGSEAWKDIKTGLESAADELQKAFKNAAAKFKDENRV
jgi:hypothetical protein